VVASITEGEDKPIKYPHMFRASQLLLLNKIDLLPHLDFDVARFLDYAHQVNPLLKVLEISAKSGEGMKEWYDWLRVQSRQRPQLADPVFHQD
jgi:hydrogenase nickel incorporation protein HypB